MSLIFYDQAVFWLLFQFIFLPAKMALPRSMQAKMAPAGDRYGTTNVTLFSMMRQIAYDPTRTLALGHENYAPLS